MKVYAHNWGNSWGIIFGESFAQPKPIRLIKCATNDFYLYIRHQQSVTDYKTR